jgi:hypothetical protein
MFLTNHVLTGALIGLKIDNPLVVAPTAFGSHLVLDSLPHFGWDKMEGFRSRQGFAIAAADCTVALFTYVSLILRFPEHALGITVGMFFAALPDLAYVPMFFFNVIIGKTFLKFHAVIQWGERPWNIVVDALWAMFIISLLQRVPLG